MTTSRVIDSTDLETAGLSDRLRAEFGGTRRVAVPLISSGTGGYAWGNNFQPTSGMSHYIYEFKKGYTYYLTTNNDNAAYNYISLLDSTQTLITSISYGISGQITDMNISSYIYDMLATAAGAAATPAYIRYSCITGSTNGLTTSGNDYLYRQYTQERHISELGTEKLDVEQFRFDYRSFINVAYKGTGFLGADGAVRAQTNGWFTPYLPASEGLTLTCCRERCWPGHDTVGGTGVYYCVVWYNANLVALGGASIPLRYSNELYSAVSETTVAPAGTAYVQIAGYYFNYSVNGASWPLYYTDVENNAIGTEWSENVLRPYLRGERNICIYGDSIAAGLGNLMAWSRDMVPGLGGESWAVGGENVLDTTFRAGATPILVKGPVTLPADGSVWVDVNYVFSFENTYSFNGSTGEYAFVGKKNTQIYDAIRSSVNTTAVGVKSQRGTGVAPNTDAAGKIYLRNATGNGQPITFTGDFEVSGQRSAASYDRVEPHGIGIVMMGTNGGFAGINDASPSMSENGAADRLVNLQERIAARFLSEKYILVGFYIGAFTTSALRDYYAMEMDKHFGQKFWDMRAWLLGTARKDLSVILTAEDYTTIAAGNVPSIYLADGTHPRTVTYRAAANRILRRMLTLGWIDNFKPFEIILPASLTATVAAPTIAPASTTQVTVTPGNTPTSSTTVYLYTTSNAAVATVSASGLVTGVAAGTATITAQCRFGGATAPVDVTVA